MTKVAASEAKLHFGALIDRAQKGPVTIEKQGRPVAVVISYDSYLEQQDAGGSVAERRQALDFLDKWSKRPAVADGEREEVFDGDHRAQAIWDKYTRSV